MPQMCMANHFPLGLRQGSAASHPTAEVVFEQFLSTSSLIDSMPNITLSLISHTNVGKTTLMRTLLRRDVGEVSDHAHVTSDNQRHTLCETTAGDRLDLWDTPGFGDTAQLLRRLKEHEKPIKWMLLQTWDRLANKPLYCSQLAVRNAQDDADVVLYLVNAAETPEDAGYVDMEMEVLEWIGRPVVVLLNQVGQTCSRAQDTAEMRSLARASCPLYGPSRCADARRVHALLGAGRQYAAARS